MQLEVPPAYNKTVSSTVSNWGIIRWVHFYYYHNYSEALYYQSLNQNQNKNQQWLPSINLDIPVSH